MSGSPLELALWAAGIIIFYGLIARGMFRASEPARYELLDIGASLIANNKISAATKEQVDRRLSDVYSARAAWAILAILVCIIVTAPYHRFKVSRLEGSVPSVIKHDFARFRARWLVVTLANSPMAAAIFALLILLMIAFTISLNSITSLLMTKSNDDASGRAVHV